jgi:hypothetical protein
VILSGSFDTSLTCDFRHSLRVWQPLLVHGLKTTYVSPNTRDLVNRGESEGRGGPTTHHPQHHCLGTEYSFSRVTNLPHHNPYHHLNKTAHPSLQ